MIYYLIALSSGILLFSKQFVTNINFRARVIVLISNTLCFLIAFRSYFVGTDTLAYTKYYSTVANYSGSPFYLANNVYLFQKNKGWTIFFWIVSRISKSPNAYLFVSGLFISSIFLYVIYKSNLDIRYQLIIYILLLYLPAFNATRTFMAVAISLLAARFATQKKYLHSAVAELLAISFHNTAIIMLPVIIILIIKWNKSRMKKAVIVIVSIVLFFPLLLNFFVWLFPVYEHTLASVLDQAQGKNILYQVIFIFSIIYGKNILDNYQLDANEYQRIASLIVIFIIEIVLGGIGYQKWYIQRILPYLQSYLLFFAPILLQYEYKYKNLYKACLYIILAAGFIYTVAWNKGEINPYSTWIRDSWITLR